MRYVNDMRDHLTRQETNPTTFQESINDALPLVGNQFHQLNQLTTQGHAALDASVAHWGQKSQQEVVSLGRIVQASIDQLGQRLLDGMHRQTSLLLRDQDNFRRYIADYPNHQPTNCRPPLPPQEYVPLPIYRRVDYGPNQAATLHPTAPPATEQPQHRQQAPPLPHTTTTVTAQQRNNGPVVAATTRTPTTEAARAPATNDLPSLSNFPSIQALVPASVYPNLVPVLEDWWGFGHSRFAPFGGLFGLEKQFSKGQWRQGMPEKDQKQFRRVRYVAKCIAVHTSINLGKQYESDTIFDVELTEAELRQGAASLWNHIVTVQPKPKAKTLSGMADKALKGYV